MLQLFNRFVSSPVFATVTTVLAVIAGLLGSVYQSEVAAAFPLTFSSPVAAMSPRAVVFWASVIAFALMFFARQGSDDRNRERLESLVRTMPPRAFQGKLAESVGGAHRGVGLIMPRTRQATVTVEGLEAFGRSLLNSVATLAQIFDDQPLTGKGSALYSANVMLYQPTSTPVPPDCEVLFVPPEGELDKFTGLLVFRQELSATSEKPRRGEEVDPDRRIPSIALPVPHESKRGDLWAVLPGAPKAFLTDDVDGYSNTQTMADWCQEKGDFQPSVVGAVRKYFGDGDGASIRSLISRPLIVKDDAMQDVKIGVLNIQSNRPGILGDFAERLPIFQAMLTPILLELAEVMAEIVKLGPSAAPPVPPAPAPGVTPAAPAGPAATVAQGSGKGSNPSDMR
jgi:hypothetical protein